MKQSQISASEPDWRPAHRPKRNSTHRSYRTRLWPALLFGLQMLSFTLPTVARADANFRVFARNTNIAVANTESAAIGADRPIMSASTGSNPNKMSTQSQRHRLPPCAAGGAENSNELVFHDEFNGTTNDLYAESEIKFPWPKNTNAAWLIFDHMRDPQSKRTMLDYFLTKNALSVDGGVLHVSALNEPYVIKPGTENEHTYPVIAGRLYSARMFQYGYFEFRAKVPHGPGFWPGLWLFNPHHGEIDVVEGEGNKTIYSGNIYYSGDTPLTGVSDFIDPTRNIPGSAVVLRGGRFDPQGQRQSYRSLSVPNFNAHDLSNEFHTYAVDWQPWGITFYFDGKPYFHSTRTITDPMQIILNFSMHTLAPGSLPASLDVDYVRVYKHVPRALAVGNIPILQLGPSSAGTYDLPANSLTYGPVPSGSNSK